MSWNLQGQVLRASGPQANLEASRAFGPSVLEEDGGALRMWYSGHDGSNGRILEAVQQPGKPWERLGVSIDAGLAGESDAYGVESPSVVVTPGGYLMAYAGSDGADTRLHIATSPDGHGWEGQGTFMQRGEADEVGATHPCLLGRVNVGGCSIRVSTGPRTDAEPRSSPRYPTRAPRGTGWGRSWNPTTTSSPCAKPWVVEAQRHFYMFYASDDDRRPTIQTATSEDGVFWHRQGITLTGSGEDVDTLGVRSPCVLRLHDGTLRLWYAGRPPGAVEEAYRLCSADFTGKDDWLAAE